MNGPPRLIHKVTNKIFGYQCFIPDLTLHCQTIVDIKNIVNIGSAILSSITYTCLIVDEYSICLTQLFVNTTF